MFKNSVFVRKGDLYDDAVSKLQGHSSSNHALICSSLRHLQFQHFWNDTLAGSQARPFKVVAVWEDWDGTVEGAVAADLACLPLLALSVYPNAAAPVRVTILTIRGNGATFYLPNLRKCGRGNLPLPRAVLDWLAASHILVVGCGLEYAVRSGLLQTQIRSYSDSTRLFEHLSKMGVITAAVPAPSSDLASQMTLVLGYHHLPASKQELCDLIGGCGFKGELPVSRWKTFSIPDQARIDPAPLFHLFYNTAGPLCVVLRFAEHGVLFHTIPGVDSAAAPPVLFRKFLAEECYNGNICSPPPPDTDENANLFPHPPQKQVQENDTDTHQDHTYSSEQVPGAQAQVPTSPSVMEVPQTPPPVIDLSTPAASAPSSPHAAAATAPAQGQKAGRKRPSPTQTEEEEQEQEVLELQDEELIRDVEQRPRSPAPPPAPSEKHPGYFTSSFKRKVTMLNENITAQISTSTSSAPAAVSAQVPSSTAPQAAAPPHPSPQPSSSLAGRLGTKTSPKRRRTSPSRNARSSSTSARRSPRRVPPPPRRDPRKDTRSASPARRQRRPSPPRPAWHRHHQRERDGPRRSFPPVDLDKKEEKKLDVFSHSDLRSKLLVNHPHSAGQLAREATSAARTPIGAPAARGLNTPVSPHADKNVNIARRTQNNSERGEFISRHRHLPVAESDLSVRCREGTATDKQRLQQRHFSVPERYENKFSANPGIESRCDFCGSRRCSRLAQGSGAPNCNRYEEQVRFAPTRRLCSYRRCRNNTQHHTQVCPHMLKRCPLCQCRGHDELDRCNEASPEIMDRLRADWEECADEVLYARDRAQSLCWGWYPYPRGAPIDFAPTCYHMLTEMPVLQALSFIRSLLAQAQNQGHFPAFIPSDPPGPPSPPPPPPPGPGAAPAQALAQ